jgi:hypothetical protein
MKYKIVEPTLTAQEQAYKDFEAKLVAHLKAMDKAGKANFNDWLACQQALLQMRQVHAAESMLEILRHWAKNGVYMGPFFG